MIVNQYCARTRFTKDHRRPIDEGINIETNIKKLKLGSDKEDVILF